jgi:hypothetical protein
MKHHYTCILTFCLLVLFATTAFAMSEREYTQKARRLHAVTVYNAQEALSVRARRPDAALDLRGHVSGVLGCNDEAFVMLQMSDGETVEVRSKAFPAELLSGTRVMCLAKTSDSAGSGALQVLAALVDTSPPDSGNRIQARPLIMREPARPAASRPAVLLSRGGDSALNTCRRAIAYFNPKLSGAEVESIATSIVGYSAYVGIDPYFIVAVVAAESRFNPNARSYKGAMGLGQLMPGTAAGMGVTNAYDPAQNLAAAILILRNHLEKYKGEPYQAALALAAYNAGAGAVKKHGGVPPYRETRNYIWKVYEYYCWMHGVKPEARPK